MDKKLVRFSLADDIKSETPAGYVESLEKLVNDIMIPRELEKMCTQEGRVYNYSFADYQKMAREIWRYPIYVTIKNAPHRVLCGSVGSANHQNASYHTYWRLVADDGTHSYQAQEQHCAAECICEELQVFANQNNGRLQWLVKSLLAKQIGYQALRQKMGLQYLQLGADDEIKSIYNIKKGATISGDARLVNDVFLNTSWDDQMRQIADKVSYGLRELAPLLCDGSVIDGDNSKNCIFVSHPSLRCGENIVGSSHYKHNVDHCLYRKNYLLDPGVHELARIINNKIEFGRRLRGSGNVVETEPVMPGVTGAKIHSDVYDVVKGLETEYLVKDLRTLASKLDGDAVLGADKTTNHVFVDHPSFKYGTESVLGVANYKLPTSSVVGAMNRIARAGGVDGFAKEINNRIAFYKKLKLKKTNTKQR